MDITSLQSIQQQLNSMPFEPSISKTQYLKNLKSQCLYRQNAIKTAQILIQEYYHENQQLKLQVMRLNQKIQNYQERIQILQHQLSAQDHTHSNHYQKQLFKSSYKLSQILQKYSLLQQKYHQLEKQTLKIKQNQSLQSNMLIKHNQEEQKLIKIDIEKQFNNFLKTPTNKNTSHQANPNASTQKKSFSKNNQKPQLNQHISSSQEQVKLNNILKHQNKQKDITQSIYDFQLNKNHIIQKSPFNKNQTNQFNKIAQNFPFNNQSSHFKKIAQDKTRIMSYDQNQQSQRNQILQQKNYQKLIKKLKVLEWKVKQKDQQILLMLKRNKQIQGKYSLLKQIFQKQKDNQSLEYEDKRFQNLQVKMHKESQKSQRKNRVSKNTKNSHKKQSCSNDQHTLQDSPKISKKLSTRISTSYRNNQEDNRTWKNFQTKKHY